MENKSITLNQFNIIGQKIDVDFNNLKENAQLESLVLKNFIIDEMCINTINSLKELKDLWFVGCKFVTDNTINHIESLRIENCKNISPLLFNDKLKILFISNCSIIDISGIKCEKLISFGLDNVEVINLHEIESFHKLEYLYLMNVNINERLDYNKITYLKKINFSGSSISKEIIELLKEKNIEVIF